MMMMLKNQDAIKQLESEDYMASVKHVGLSAKYMCDYAKKGLVKPQYVESRLMMADMLTKALSASRMSELREIFNLK